jgi:probable phosphoglycerate mutase
MNLVYLVRHGENPANITKEFSCRRVDYPLTEKGVHQAEQTAAFFRDKRIDAIYTSTLRRAAQTAEIIAAALGLAAIPMDQFRETNVGVFEDLPPTPENWAEHDRIMAAWRMRCFDETFPGGENYHMLLARMRDGLAQALASRDGQRIIIVGHGGIFSATIKAFCPEADLEAILSRPYHNCAITELELEHTAGRVGGRVLAWAQHAHLRGWAAELIPGTPREMVPDRRPLR